MRSTQVSVLCATLRHRPTSAQDPGQLRPHHVHLVHPRYQQKKKDQVSRLPQENQGHWQCLFDPPNEFQHSIRSGDAHWATAVNRLPPAKAVQKSKLLGPQSKTEALLLQLPRGRHLSVMHRHDSRPRCLFCDWSYRNPQTCTKANWTETNEPTGDKPTRQKLCQPHRSASAQPRTQPARYWGKWRKPLEHSRKSNGGVSQRERGSLQSFHQPQL